MYKRFTLPILILCFSFGAEGQDVDVGLTLGMAAYNGDLSPAAFTVYTDNIRPSGGVYARYTYRQNLGARYGLSYGHLAGDEKLGGVNYSRGLKFRTHFAEVSGLGELYLLNQRFIVSKMIFSFYVTGGIAIFHFDPKTNIARSTDIRLKPLRTEGQGLPGYDKPYSLIQMSIPYGFGIRLTKKSRWGFGMEVITRRALTDYLDDVSSRTVRYGDIYQNYGPASARWSNPLLDPSPDNFDALYERGNARPDHFFTIGVSVSYRLLNRGVSKSHEIGVRECPRF